MACCDYERPAIGALSPVAATTDMTKPVGQRDGQLFTKPGEVLPDPTPNGAILEVVSGEWSASTEIPDAMDDLEEGLDDIGDRLDTLEDWQETTESTLEDDLTSIRNINGIQSGGLATQISAVGDAKTAIKNAANSLEAGILTSDQFGGSESAYASKLATLKTTILGYIDDIIRDEAPTVISTGLSEIRSILDDLKTAINAVSPSTLTASSPLEDYVDSVEDITEVVPKLGEDASGYQYMIIDEWSVPTVKEDGTPATQTFSGTNAATIGALKSIIIPAYFGTYAYLFDASRYGSGLSSLLEKLTVRSAHVTSSSAFNYTNFPSLREVDLSSATTFTSTSQQVTIRGGDDTHGITLKTGAYSGTLFFVNMATTNASSLTTGVPITVDCPSVSRLGNSYNAGIVATNLTGTMEFPECTYCRYISGGAYPLTVKLPYLTEFAGKVTSDGGDVNVFIGPNLTSAPSALEGTSYLHIPAGESTTKTTLDAAGIAYTQDYEP